MKREKKENVKKERKTENYEETSLIEHEEKMQENRKRGKRRKTGS